MPELSVVLISKNQAWNVKRLIESVLRETTRVSSREVILVDSASTDDTVAQASAYAITILRLRSDQHLSPAAGRYVGYQHTTGNFVLFLDGDMELCSGWLEQAFHILATSPEVAVVTGQTLDLLPTAQAYEKPPLPPETGAASTIPACAGAALYRRSVLAEVGPFNPYLRSEEEPELCLRIRHAGYRIVDLHYPIAYHYSNPEGALSTLIARWRRNLYLGDGQVLRYHLGSTLLWTYIKERGYVCLPLVGLAVGLGSFLWSYWHRQWIWFGLWLLLCCHHCWRCAA